jgi:hypothetical protein
MLSATVLAIFLVPMFFVVVYNLFVARKQADRPLPKTMRAPPRPREPETRDQIPNHAGGRAARPAAVGVQHGAALCPAGCGRAPALPQGRRLPAADAAQTQDLARIGWREFFATTACGR